MKWLNSFAILCFGSFSLAQPALFLSETSETSLPTEQEDQQSLLFSDVTQLAQVSSAGGISQNKPATTPSLSPFQKENSTGLNVTPLRGLTVSEDGSISASFYISANTPPRADIAIPLIFNPLLIELDKTTVILAAGSSTPVKVRLYGVDNAMADGDTPFTITLGKPDSEDPAFQQHPTEKVAVIRGHVVDDDAVGIAVVPNGIEPLETTEDGSRATFSLVLKSKPTQSVSVGLMSSANEEGQCEPKMIVFEPETWNIPQTVTVTGVDDAIDDGHVAYRLLTLPAKSSDPTYQGYNPKNISLVNRDNGDHAAILVNRSSGSKVAGKGKSDHLEVVLNSEPLFDVHIPFQLRHSAQGTKAKARDKVQVLTFSKQNWQQPQRIKIPPHGFYGKRSSFLVISGDPASNDPKYDAFTADQLPDITLGEVEGQEKAARADLGSSHTLDSSERPDPASSPVRLTSPTHNLIPGSIVSSDPMYEKDAGHNPGDAAMTNLGNGSCGLVSLSCLPGGPMAITGNPGCLVDVYDATHASTQSEWVLIAQNIEIPLSGTVLVSGSMCQPDRSYLVTNAGNPAQILNRFQTVPTLNAYALVVLILFLNVSVLVLNHRRKTKCLESGKSHLTSPAKI